MTQRAKPHTVRAPFTDNVADDIDEMFEQLYRALEPATVAYALTRTDDTNVTLTLTGTPTSALLAAVALTLGWTGQLAVTRGGTGLAEVAQGDLLYGSAANTLAALAKNTTATRYLANTGTNNNPAWAQLNLANGVTGVLPLANLPDLTGLTVDTSVQDMILQNEFGYREANTVAQGYMVLNGSPAGTRTFTIGTTNTFATYTTGAVAGNRAGFRSLDTSILAAQNDFDLKMVIQTPADITSLRYWLGLTDTAQWADADDQGGTSDYAAFRYSTVAADGGWVGVSRDGTTQSVSATVAVIAASTDYTLRIRKSGSTLYFSVNGGAEVSKTTNLPTAAAGLAFCIGVSTQVAEVREILHSRSWCKYGT